jgi:formamidopyrimidine-DNA glycosylase
MKVPELPEVETVRRGISPHVLNRRIEQVVVRDARLRWPVPKTFARYAQGRRVAEVGRRGKYLILTLDNADRILIHLGMSGRLFLRTTGHPLQKHDHVDLLFDGGVLLRFQDARRFGAMLPWPARQLTHPLMETMGPEPFSAEFSGDYLFALSRGRSAPVKNLLMDGRVVVGAGNIYATESLFRAGIRPNRSAGRLTRVQCQLLVDKVREVLAEAIEQGGTTLRDFAGAGGEAGYFQQKLYAYGREAQACLVCGTPIRRVVIGQRSSYYCPSCQR